MDMMIFIQVCVNEQKSKVIIEQFVGGFVNVNVYETANHEAYAQLRLLILLRSPPAPRWFGGCLPAD